MELYMLLQKKQYENDNGEMNYNCSVTNVKRDIDAVLSAGGFVFTFPAFKKVKGITCEYEVELEGECKCKCS